MAMATATATATETAEDDERPGHSRTVMRRGGQLAIAGSERGSGSGLHYPFGIHPSLLQKETLKTLVEGGTDALEEVQGMLVGPERLAYKKRAQRRRHEVAEGRVDEEKYPWLSYQGSGGKYTLNAGQLHDLSKKEGRPFTFDTLEPGEVINEDKIRCEQCDAPVRRFLLDSKIPPPGQLTKATFIRKCSNTKCPSLPRPQEISEEKLVLWDAPEDTVALLGKPLQEIIANEETYFPLEEGQSHKNIVDEALSTDWDQELRNLDELERSLKVRELEFQSAVRILKSAATTMDLHIPEEDEEVIEDTDEENQNDSVDSEKMSQKFEEFEKNYESPSLREQLTLSDDNSDDDNDDFVSCHGSDEDKGTSTSKDALTKPLAKLMKSTKVSSVESLSSSDESSSASSVTSDDLVGDDYNVAPGDEINLSDADDEEGEDGNDGVETLPIGGSVVPPFQENAYEDMLNAPLPVASFNVVSYESGYQAVIPCESDSDD